MSHSVSRPNRPRGAIALLRWLLACDTRFRMRAALARLDPRLLRDIGVSEADASMEAGKPFWKP